jgi:NitT/TauT family transport system permease protein
VRYLATLGTVIFLAALLEAAVVFGLLPALVVARPTEVFAALPHLASEEGLAMRFWVTLTETGAAAGLAALIGIPIGWLFFNFPRLDAAFRRWLAVLAAAPMILLYPLFLVAFGRNYGTVVAIGFAAALAPVALKTRDGLYGIRPVLIDVGHSFRLRPGAVFRWIMVPAAMPTIMTGIRLGLVFALVNVVAVEFLINFGGLGQLVVEMADRYETPSMYAAIFLIALISACFYAATEGLERWFRPA